MKYAMASALAIAALVLVPAAAAAGPCAPGIHDAQVAFDHRLEAAAAKGPSGEQSQAAQLHHQPSLKSVAQAEAELGDISPEVGRAFGEAIRRARAADAAGDEPACTAALGEARAILAQ